MKESYQPDIENAILMLRQGGVILYPTDTIWGLGCDATDHEAVKRVYRIKNRVDHKAMIVLVADEKDILKYTAAPDLSAFSYLKQTTKPTTVIYEGALGLAGNLTGQDGSVAIRICRDEFCRHLIKRFRKPIVSTSANISGTPPPANFSEVSDEIRQVVDYVVSYRQDDPGQAVPSAIIRWEQGKITVIRP